MKLKAQNRIEVLLSSRCIHASQFSLPITEYHYIIETLSLVKTFNIEVLPDLHVLRTPEFKKWFQKNTTCVCDCVGNLQKLIKIETPNYTQ